MDALDADDGMVTGRNLEILEGASASIVDGGTTGGCSRAAGSDPGVKAVALEANITYQIK